MTDSAVKTYKYEDIEKIANYLKSQINVVPKIGIICGSGLGSMGESVQNAQMFDYKDIPNFPVSTVIGHKGRLIFGYISNCPVVCMQGRFHYYEGYPLSTCVMPIKLMKLLGVTHLIVSNAAGGIKPNFKVGDIMIIKDHISLMGFAGNHAERGPHDERFGPRFQPMNDAYCPKIREAVQKIARNLADGRTITEGVYSAVGGPNYETIAELRAMKSLGIDAIGMSTVHEVITARYCGLICFGFSLITNVCKTEYENQVTPNGEEVVEVGKTNEPFLKSFVENVVQYIADQ